MDEINKQVPNPLGVLFSFQCTQCLMVFKDLESQVQALQEESWHGSLQPQSCQVPREQQCLCTIYVRAQKSKYGLRIEWDKQFLFVNQSSDAQRPSCERGNFI